MDKKQDYKLRGIKSGDKQRIPWEDRVDSFRQVHGNTYEYDCKDYKTNKSKIVITCHKHGNFEMFMVSHLKGAGCKECKKEKTKKYKLESIPVEIRKIERIKTTVRKNKERTFPISVIEHKLYEKYGDKFTYDMSTYVNQKSIVKLICPTHGEKNLSVERILENKHGCPNCANINISKQEFEWLVLHGITIHQYKINCNGNIYYVDGIDLDTNTVYEYLGEYWHGHPSEEIRTGSKINKRCKKEFSQLFTETENRFNIINNCGYDIIYRWSKEDQNRRFGGVLL